MTPLDVLIRRRITAEGPLRYSDVVEAALYHPTHGFYSVGHGAGRRRDFLTSPEVGPLFGAVVAEAVDQEWQRLGQPEEFTVIDVGAGPGSLARSFALAEPDCFASVRWLSVERSAAQRSQYPDWVEGREQLPTDPFTGVVIANELLDNVPFDPIEYRDGRWGYIRVDEVEGELVEIWDSTTAVDPWPGLDPQMTRAVAQHAASSWLDQVLTTMHAGTIVVFDYCRTDSSLVSIRGYEAHERRSDVLERLGTKDITVDVDINQLKAVALPQSVEPQRAWLNRYGIEDLVEEGRCAWERGAASGDLVALAGRSRVRESEALCDPAGLGGFTAIEWSVGH